jgi:cytochrome P450
MTDTEIDPVDGDDRGPGGCPVVNVDIGLPGPILSHFEEWDELRERYPAFWSELYGGHWVLTRFEAIRHALQEPATFSNASTIVSDPDPEYTFIPTFLDPPEHGKYRTLYNARFSPGMVTRVTPAAREAANRYIDAFIDDGRCEFMSAFADPFPTDVFLNAVNLPTADTPKFVRWVHAVFGGLSGQEQESGLDAQGEMHEYFAAMFAQRRAEPLDPEIDILTYLLSATVDGAAIPEADLLNMAVVLVLAGLDTTKSQLGYNFHHLATHPDDRARLVADPSLMPTAIEELLRVHAFVPPARKIKQDVVYEGCPMRAGQMVLMPLWSATRDPRAFEDAGTVRLDRTPNRHIAFGAGPHRCAGAHLARRELLVAMEEWHRRIPDYEIEPGVDIVEHGWQCGPDNLPLVWS